MFAPSAPLAPDRWIASIFACKAAQEGRVVRRKLSDIERYASIGALRAELHRRGFSAIRNGDTVLIICNQEPVTRFG